MSETDKEGPASCCEQLAGDGRTIAACNGALCNPHTTPSCFPCQALHRDIDAVVLALEDVQRRAAFWVALEVELRAVKRDFEALAWAQEAVA